MNAGLTLLSVAMRSSRCATFLSLIEAAGLGDSFRKKGPFTVFAPNQGAFAKMDPAKLEALLKDPKAAKRFVQGHMVKGKLVSADLRKKKSFKSLEGDVLTISGVRPLLVNEAKITLEDNVASNGALHIVDQIVIRPAQ
jgi:uncharacterized surface protein with fasciclin (FAS1) repeats